MYRANVERKKQQAQFSDYREYLLSLNMQGTIRSFEPLYIARIAQLTNKSNQFNLTTARYTQGEIEAFAADERYITRYGKLADRFGDNGVVSVVIGRRGGMEDVAVYRQGGQTSRALAAGKDESAGQSVLHIELWLMSCRVLKRDMECAMMDNIVEACQACGIGTIMGYYYPTAKNAMVKDFYGSMGFVMMEKTDTDVTVWRYEIPADYVPKNTVIAVEDEKETD